MDVQVALFLVWIVATVATGFGAFVASLRFISLHSRTYHEFMSDTERTALFVRQPRSYLTRAIPDGLARSNRLFIGVDDPGVEAARRMTLRFAGAAIASAIVGLPVLWLSAGVVRRAEADLLAWSIVALWLVVLAAAFERRAHAAAILIVALATVGSLLAVLIGRSF